ncbi:efflux RND transporter permease subunit [Paracoccus aestuariivivens]|uniref:Efflux pump membrane transporter n=1 Tax=Paracoccus aestuariivivens TaxID=1820333 RepID=A0A6L6J6M3_9RHOB|nr:multidrug efflux RND transporter permease subunit [Paracoccus aestuariivivens]MTH76805.1 multidrug efflux RND transporter permease subunit [Paracoccus aestuariivivens]
MGPQFFIRRPRFAFVISIVITLMGLLTLVVMPIDQYPDISAPKVVVNANYPGASADTVKDSIASPIESQVNGAEGMVYMSSKSASDGSYTLTITFEVGTDADLAQVDVQNRVKLAEAQLPEEVRRRGVKVRKRNPDILMVVNLLSPDNRFDRVFLSNYASLNIEAELGRLPGVSEASIIGALDYGMRAWLDPVKLANQGITVKEVIGAIRDQNVQAAVGQLGAAPSPDSTEFQYVLTTQGRLKNTEEFGNIVLRADASGSILRLKDVARIELGAEVYKGYGEFNNSPGVLMAIYKLSDANSLDVAKGVRAKMDELSQSFPEGIEYAVGHDTTLFIASSLEETAMTLIFTVLLVIAVTYVFLGSLRATLIPAIAVPVSIIGTLAVLYGLGLTINTVTLFALILAIGVVVDDAIIVVENVERLMHHDGLSAREATQKAMQEVAGPIVATSLVLAAVFGPATLLPGITGRMFANFGTTLVVAVLISMVNAMTLSPALAATLMKHGGEPNFFIRGFNRIFEKVTNGYVAIVDFLARHMLISLVLIMTLLASLGILFVRTPTSFIPNEDKGFFIVDIQLPQAASLARTELVMDKISEALKKDESVENVVSVNGYSILNTALQSNTGMIIAKLKPWDERKAPEQSQVALQAKYQAMFGQMPEAVATVFGAPAIPGLGTVAGFSYVLEDTQSRSPEELATALHALIAGANARPEIARAFSTFNAGAPQLEIVVDRIRAQTLGVPISDIFLTLQTELGGAYVNDFNLYGETYRVMVQADAEFRQNENDLQDFYVRNNTGNLVPLSTLVTIKPSRGADVLYRYNTYDSATITGIPNGPGGFSTGDAMNAMEQVTADAAPPGYRYEWTDSSFEERKSGNAVPIALGLSLVFTFLFLAALYESFMTPFAIILSVPIALVGALIGTGLAGQPLSLYGQIGLLLLIGLAAKTAILIVEFGKTLREVEGMDLHEATLTAARLRFRPVMMTSLAFIAGVFPLVIATGAGAASRVSLGVAVFGGTIMSAIAGSIFVPVYFKMIQWLREKVHGGKTKAPE